MSEAVAVTGAGAISALGPTLAASWAALRDGSVRPPRLPRDLDRPDLRTSLPQEYPVFAVDEPLDPADLRLGRTAALALRALGEALDAAALDRSAIGPTRIGVCLGTTVGCTLNDEAFYRAFRGGEAGGARSIGRYVAGEVSRAVATRVGARGPVITVADACASGLDAIGLGCGWLRAGLCDVVVAGGADELTRYAYLGFHSLGNMSRQGCRPFDRQRSGLSLGEGAAVFILERQADARRRAAPVAALVLGHASAADAHHPTAPHPEGRGLRQALAAALADASLDATEIGVIHGHGTGTADNDRVEGKVLADLLPGVPLSASKGATGHTLGAAGALGAAFLLSSLREGLAPASPGHLEPDPACAVAPLREPVRLDARAGLTTALAFGGGNSVLVLGRAP